jgi:hypothetical protein
LTILRDDEHGLFGGFLVLNSLGRPLEFHCTAPVRPNRAQEILYGPTLEPYLYGERIGPALLEKAKSQPVVVLTDVPSAMSTRQFVSTPMMLVVSGSQRGGEQRVSSANDPQRSWRCDPAHQPPHAGDGTLHHFALGDYQIGVDRQFRDDEQVLVDSWPQFATQIDLDEPFGRIRDAIDEARRGVSA